MESNSLQGRQQVVAALDELRIELAAGAQDWENDRLDLYLEAVVELLLVIENAYTNNNRPVPDDPWAVMADVLRGARYYE
jgi:hypothetical protein